MDINYYKKYEPIDGKWYITKELGSGAFGKVFEIERRDFTNDKSALKIITIPSSSNEVKSYREENYDLDEQSISSYFYGFVEEFTKEFALMTKLKGQNNVVRIEDYDVKEHEDEVGWDIFIRMELLTPMNHYFAKNSPKTRDVIKLGIDICKALEVCQKFNIVHRDIKPSNIFVSETGEYKLGDFGVARTLEKTSSGLSKKGTYTYMAPEVYKGEAYSSNVDIYSLGIVMYKLLNNNMEPYKQGRTHEDEENALIARLKGEPMSKPANADGRLAEIILKACAFEPKDRYESPLQMRNELESILYSENEEKIIYPEGEKLDYEPSNGPIEEEPVTSGIFDNVSQNDILKEDELTSGIFDVVEDKSVDENKTEVLEEQVDNGENSEAKRELSWKGILAICSVLLIVIIAAIWGATTNGGNKENTTVDDLYEAYRISDVSLRMLDTDYVVEEYAMCFAKEKIELNYQVDMALNELESEGVKQAIIDKYILGEDHEYEFQQNVDNKPKLRVAINAAFPPYEYSNSMNGAGEKIYEGINIEIAQAIADKLDMKLVIEDMDFDEIISAVQSGKVDMGMGGITITEERLQRVNFSYQYVTNSQVVLVREDSSISSIDDLYSGCLIGVENNTAGSYFAGFDFDPNNVINHSTSQEAVGAMIRGEIDCVILDKAVAELYLAANGSSTTNDYAGQTIRVGYTVFEPVAYYENGELVGFDIELAQYILGDKLSMNVEFIEISWDQKEEMIEDGSIDCIWNAMEQTEERLSTMACTDPYITKSAADGSDSNWIVGFNNKNSELALLVNDEIYKAHDTILALIEKYDLNSMEY